MQPSISSRIPGTSAAAAPARRPPAREALAAAAENEMFDAKDFRDRTGIGRNLTIEVLEYFDRTGFTRRTQSGRRIQRPAAEVFGIEE